MSTRRKKMTQSIRHLDLCGDQKNPPPPKTGPKGKVNIAQVRAGKVVVRNPATIKGIGIHQTACVFGPMADPEKRYRRALNVPSHALSFRDGVFATAFPLEWYMYHGNELNAFTLGLEIEGHYPGRPDDPSTPSREDIQSTWGGKPTPFDDLAIETARAALKYLVETGRNRNMPIEYVWAHRQSNGQKPSDPGYEIWKHVVLEYGCTQLGLKTEPGRAWRDGKAIPGAWDPKAIGKY
jgi:hypothetical protein